MVEGEKSVDELIHSSFRILSICASPEWIERNPITSDTEVFEATRTDLERMSFFKTASPVVAVVEQRLDASPKLDQDWILALDGINDPGNLGTIIRIADWYGIRQIWCSPNTVEVYNPKTISSTMGSFTRVDVLYIDLAKTLSEVDSPLLFALMEGKVASQFTDIKKGILVIGSEANGISDELLNLKHQAITIPRVGKAESLNAGVATAILCDRLILG